MSDIKNTFSLTSTKVEDVEDISRRSTDRRRSTRRSCSKPRMIGPDRILILRKQDSSAPFIYRESDRRQNSRRKSKPSLLKVDEIVLLRKK